MAVGLRGTTLFSDANLTAYYELESGALTTDSIGGFTLTNNNAVTATGARFNSGADFGSSNTNKSLTRTGDNWGVNALNTWSVSLWISLDTEISSGTYGIWSINQATRNTNVDLLYEFNGGTRRLNLRRGKNGSAIENATYTIALGAGIFHNIICSYDGATLKVYVDNSAPQTNAASGDGPNSVTANSFLGASSPNSSFASAIIDDTAIFNRTLTTGDVTTIWLSPVGGGMIGKFYGG